MLVLGVVEVSYERATPVPRIRDRLRTGQCKRSAPHYRKVIVLKLRGAVCGMCGMSF